KQILAKYLNGQTLAEVSTWADTIKGKPAVWDQTFSYHYESVADNQTYLQSLQAQKPEIQKNGGAVAGILEAERLFRDPRSKPEQKNMALKFLVHFVGDIHQPFHSGRPEDRGGNQAPKKWHSKNSNLHAIWDVLILEEAYTPQRKKNESKIDEAAYAEALVTKYLNRPLPGDADDIDLWIQESISLRDDAYKFQNDDEATYTGRFVDSVDERIFSGGVRLAAILTKLVRGESDSKVEIGFRSAIENILGPLEKIINLNPKAKAITR
ncbi:MAG: S1/P1 nuclease, partial [Pseudobdellovibrionaceae bacterium]